MDPLSSFPSTDSVLIKVSSFLILRLFFMKKTFLFYLMNVHSIPDLEKGKLLHISIVER